MIGVLPDKTIYHAPPGDNLTSIFKNEYTSKAGKKLISKNYFPFFPKFSKFRFLKKLISKIDFKFFKFSDLWKCSPRSNLNRFWGILTVKLLIFHSDLYVWINVNISFIHYTSLDFFNGKWGLNLLKSAILESVIIWHNVNQSVHYIILCQITSMSLLCQIIFPNILPIMSNLSYSSYFSYYVKLF